MDLSQLLVLFRALESRRIDYTVTGDLADALQGRVSLTEHLEIAVVPEPAILEKIREAICSVWPNAEFGEMDSATGFRVLPAGTPFFLDVIAQQVEDSTTVNLSGMRVRVSSPSLCAWRRDWSRPNFSLRERVDAVQALSREILPARPHVRGVRKYRFIEAAKADRDARFAN